MRNVLLILITCSLITLSGCKGDSESSGDGSSASSGGGRAVAVPQDGAIGTWRDNVSNPLFFSNISIYAEDGQLYLENKFDDGSSRRRQVVEKKSDLGRRFDPVIPTRLGDHWVIDENGDLLLRDQHGTAAKAEKIEDANR